MRINKYIAGCGVASRRQADRLIEEGRISINGAIVDRPGVDVREGDVVTLDGEIITLFKERLYYAFNKPAGYITTSADERGRPTIYDLLSDIGERVFPVGRLDAATSGLLILTNDGEAAQRLARPKSKIYKVYEAKVEGAVLRRELDVLKAGVDIGGYVTMPAEASIIKEGKAWTLLEISIHEGKNRQVRKMCEAVGHRVIELRRTAFGDIRLGRLKEGHFRKLNPKEIAFIKELSK